MKKLKEKMYKLFVTRNKPEKLVKIFNDLQNDFETLYVSDSPAWDGVGMLFLHAHRASSTQNDDGTKTNDYIGGHALFGDSDVIVSAIANLLREDTFLRRKVLEDLHKDTLRSPLDASQNSDS